MKDKVRGTTDALRGKEPGVEGTPAEAQAKRRAAVDQVESVRKAAAPEKAKDAAQAEMPKAQAAYGVRSIGFEPGAQGKQHVVARTEDEAKGADFPTSSGMPPDIEAERAGLKDERAIKRFKFKVGNICKDPANPSSRQIDTVRAMIAGVRKAGNGDLEAGLVAQWEEANPAPVELSPEAAASVAELEKLCKSVIKALELGKKTHPLLEGDLNRMITDRVIPEVQGASRG